MALTPVEIRHVRLGRGLFGYRRRATDSLLEEVTESFEAVWRERADLLDRVEQLEADLVRHRELESLLRTTLVSAERSAAQLKEQAQREADVILAEARSEARAVVREAAADRERLLGETRRIRALLTSALATLEAPAEGSAEAVAKAEAA
jgi:cell division initiation protein